jgi:cell wall-associated NlpC family hydrolase
MYWRGSYSNADEANKVIRDNFGSLEGVVDNFIQGSHVSRLQRGDVIVCNYKDGPLTLGIYFGEVTYLTTEQGSRPFPSRALSIKRSWKPCLKP